MQRLFWSIGVAAVIATVACAGPGSQVGQPASQAPGAGSLRRSLRADVSFKFKTVDDQSDPTFNELLGINNEGKFTGFFGDGSPGHFNRGYIIYPPYGRVNFRNEDYPTAEDTQVTSVNNKKSTAGFFVDTKNNAYGFSLINGIWNEYKNPHGHRARPQITEILGLNDARIGVGFYTTASGVDRAFSVNMPTGVYSEISPPGATSAVATGISGPGDICGYFKKQTQTDGFLLRQGKYTELAFPGATETRFLGITLHDQIVGSYIDHQGQTHGFLLGNPLEKSIAWETIDEPDAAGTTVLTGINVHDDVVGYYVDSTGNTHGFWATPN